MVGVVVEVGVGVGVVVEVGVVVVVEVGVGVEVGVVVGVGVEVVVEVGVGVEVVVENRLTPSQRLIKVMRHSPEAVSNRERCPKNGSLIGSVERPLSLFRFRPLMIQPSGFFICAA